MFEPAAPRPETTAGEREAENWRKEIEDLGGYMAPPRINALAAAIDRVAAEAHAKGKAEGEVGAFNRMWVIGDEYLKTKPGPTCTEMLTLIRDSAKGTNQRETKVSEHDNDASDFCPTCGDPSVAIGHRNSFENEVRQILAPVLDWFQSDEHPARPIMDILRDVVAELQQERADNLRLTALRTSAEPCGNIYEPRFGGFRCVCKLPKGHAGLHVDGGSWDDNVGRWPDAAASQQPPAAGGGKEREA